MAARRKPVTPKRANPPKAVRSGRSATTGLETETARLTRERDEALERETATAEILQVINRSPGDLEPVFDAILEKAHHLCDAAKGALVTYDGEVFRAVATRGVSQEYATMLRAPQDNPPGSPPQLLLRGERLVHVPDMAKLDFPIPRAAARMEGVRTVLFIPLRKHDTLLGYITFYRQQVRAFTDRDIALLENFAAQAVIAIENTRLLNELREPLEQQTATAEVLGVISSSPGDLDPVFNAVLDKAMRICDAEFGNLFLFENDEFRAVLIRAPSGALANLQRNPILALSDLPHTPFARLARTKAVIHVADLTTEQAYRERNPPLLHLVKSTGARTFLAVPMLKEGRLMGTISIYRPEVRPFTEKQIELVKSFADQAVIAIENVRLLKELRERTEEVVKLNQQLEQRVADQVGEIERMSRLRRFLPPQVADLIIASGTERQLESHRREITALYCDLRGFTGFSEAADPEDVIALLREYHAAVGEIINRYSGTLERYAGDGVMVIFNDPVPVPKPALQAVQAAVDMRQAIGTLTEKWCRLGHDLGFGIGIAHGYATLGTIGFEGRFDYAAIGTVSNVASRLCDEAKPGQILISPRVLMALEDAASVESIGEFRLKGIRRPLAAYNVLAVKSAS